MTRQQLRIQQAVQEYGKRLFGFIRSRVKNDEDAEDILQDVWYQLSTIIETEPVTQLSSWLYRVSKNRIVDKKRKKTPQPLADLVYEDEEGEMVYPEALLSVDTDPESEMERHYAREALLAALAELPEKQRQVFVWNELEDLTLQEIANKTGESIKTIISRKRYAVAQLRERLRHLYSDY